MLQPYEDPYGTPYDPPYDDWNPGGPGPWTPDPEDHTGPWLPPTAPNTDPDQIATVVNPPLYAPTPPPPGGGGTSTPGGNYGTPSFDWPQFHMPDLPQIAPFSFSYENYAQADPFTPTPFSYDPFNAPTLEQAKQEPGYDFAFTEGLRALQNAKSAQGTLRTGGTLKDFIGWGNKFGEQNYGNVYNRAANTYTMNRGNAFENWGANERGRAEAFDRNEGNRFNAYKTNRDNAYTTATDTYKLNTGTSLDLSDRLFRGKLAEFNPQFDAAKSTFEDTYRRQRDLLDSLTRISTAGAAA